MTYRVKISSGVTFFDTPTMRLLNSSTVVAISAGLRLHIAFLLAGIAARIPEYFAFGLLMYATYTLDRALDCKEDAINKSELCGANRTIGLVACMIAFCAGTILLFLDGIYLAPFLPFIIGYVYSRGFRIGSFRLKLKGSLGVKNVIVGITWAGTIALIVGQWCNSIQTVGIIFLFYSMKIFVTSCVNDFKDVKGDIVAGVKTLPAYLGENLTKKVLLLILATLYSMMAYAVFFGVVRDEWIVLLFSLVVTIAFLLVYSPSFENSPALFYRKMREFVISWESLISLGLRACVAG
ncbi:UbiA family prenyltransferase [Methanoregula sp.]|uniref:UbiA family prenyltransferase n=1 Tax=Methanoregula sp. TaxID=2052170 RepID=UPI003C734051